MSSRIWTNDTRRDEGEEKGRRAQNRRLPDTKVRNRGHQAPRTRARQELVSLPFKHPHVDMHACVLWYIIVRTFNGMRYARYVTVNSQCPPADGTHTRQTETSQPVSADTQTLVPQPLLTILPVSAWLCAVCTCMLRQLLLADCRLN